MSPKMRAMVGAISVVLYAAVGAVLLAEGRSWLGGGLLVLGGLRALYLVRQVRRAVSEE